MLFRLAGPGATAVTDDASRRSHFDDFRWLVDGFHQWHGVIVDFARALPARRVGLARLTETSHSQSVLIRRREQIGAPAA